jgi:ferredoxin
MKVLRKIIEIDEDRCDGCGQCVPACAEGSLEIVDGKARVVSENLCDGLGACLGECPNDALRIVEREAEEFDEEAVEEYLAEKERQATPQKEIIHSGCPSARVQQFASAAEREGTHPDAAPASALSNWPVQIHLVPPTAPFLKGAHLLVVADCVPVAFPSLHRDFMQGKSVMIGCPKFDDIESYVEKFRQIFMAADIKSITTVMMEVPCCAALPAVVKKGMAAAGKSIPAREITVSTRGEILRRDRHSAG